MKAKTGALGRVFQDGEDIVRQGEEGNCMYVIQEGKVEVIVEDEGVEMRLAVRDQGQFFGEMAIFDREVRSATVRALGRVRVLTVDKKNLLRRIHADPSMAFHILETLSLRIRELDNEVARLRGQEQ